MTTQGRTRKMPYTQAQEQQAVTTAFDNILNVFPNSEAISKALKSVREKLCELQSEQACPEDRQELWNQQYDKVEQELQVLIDMGEDGSGEMGQALFERILGDLCTFGEDRVFCELSEEKQTELLREIQETATYITMLEAARVVAHAIARKQSGEESDENVV